MIIRQSDEIIVEAGEMKRIYRFGIMRRYDDLGYAVSLSIDVRQHERITVWYKTFSEAYKVYVSSIMSILDYQKINPETEVTVIRMR